jgi:hypothetical protein
VARKLCVLLHSLWLSGEVYDPLTPIDANDGRRRLREEAGSEAGKTPKKERRVWHNDDDPKVARKAASVRSLRISEGDCATRTWSIPKREDR